MHNIIVLGSGRSGTSMLTGILANSGYFTGENSEYLKANKSNPKGFFEDYEVNTINEDILRETLVTIPEKIRKFLFPSYTFYRARWLARLPLSKTIKSTNSINERISKIVLNKTFCYKDPRFSYTLPIWNKYLDSNTKYIVVFREPNKTADSIVRECKESLPLQKLKMTKRNALLVWNSMYAHILTNYQKSSNKENWKFFHYNQIFKNDSVAELEAFCNLKLEVSFAEKRISRSFDDNQKMDKKTQKIYNELIALSL